jgi:hypothetical protein
MTVLPPCTPRETRTIDGSDCLRCSKCKNWKPMDQFGPRSSRLSGRQSHCKPCQNQTIAECRKRAAERKAKKRTEMAQERLLNKQTGKDTPRHPKAFQKPQKRQRKPIRKVSVKRSSQNRRYLKLRMEFLAEHPTCQACKHNPSAEVHHINSRHGEMLLDFTQCAALCGICHRMVHDNPLWSKEHGLYHTELK